MIVLKFGGTSVKNNESITKVIHIIKQKIKSNDKVVVVCSALGGVTDMLLEMSRMAATGNEGYLELLKEFKKIHFDTAKKLLTKNSYKLVKQKLKKRNETLTDLLRGVFLIRESSDRSQAHIISFGERNSNFIVTNALMDHKVKADYCDARFVMVTDSNFLNATIDQNKTRRNIIDYFNKSSKKCVVFTGFISADIEGLTTVLGRGGSDYTAAVLAANLDAEVLEIWTDVNGVLSADPRKVKGAFSVQSMSYLEAMEVSHFGAKVIYPPTIKPVMDKKIPIFIKNTFNPSHPGTRIHVQPNDSGRVVTGISAISDISLITLEGSGMQGVPGVAARLFNVLSLTGVNIVLITQGSSEHAITIAISNDDVSRAIDAINKTFEMEIKRRVILKPKARKNLSILAIVGEKMSKQVGVAGKLFKSLGDDGINVVAIAQGSSELNISFVIPSDSVEHALNVIHDGFFEQHDENTIHVYMIGVGLIGGELIKQINKQEKFLFNKYGKHIKIVGLANSRKMFFDPKGIQLNHWKEQLDESTHKVDLNQFVTQMKTFGLAHSLFIDNTASATVSGIYASIFQHNISVLTANKIANSGRTTVFNKLKELSIKHGQRFYYETNVGAGLPIIGPIQNMIDTGDKITKIEAVLSGSLSYIFNKFTSSSKFVEIVKEAKELGYTEPDPRDDLSGKDLSRKIIILARLVGASINPSQVKVQNILPKSCLSAKTVKQFFSSLEKENDYFSELINTAEKSGKKLRFICSFYKAKATVKLVAIDNKSPFYTLEGSDNMIVIHSSRYRSNPLIVRGPGAGAAVTAAGVFADIIDFMK